jgi:cytochrome bd ubiquinol oxidase subunit II
LIEGIKVENGAFAGSAFDCATPFAVLCGLGLVTGYGLLGATWLIMKIDGSVATRAKMQAKFLLAFERIAVRWFSLPNFLFLWWVPAATALVHMGPGGGSRPDARPSPSLPLSPCSC